MDNILFIGSFFCIVIIFLGYPFLLFFCGKKNNSKHKEYTKQIPSLSMLVVFRNAENLIAEKIENFINLDYDNLQLVLISDGSYDASSEIIQGYINECPQHNIVFHEFSAHQGKSSCLNYGISLCEGDIVLFSDTDALLEKNAAKMLVRHFLDSSVGGVCGQRVVAEKSSLKDGQESYITWDSSLKKYEMQCNLSVTSNDGKIYAIRKKLFTPVPEAVTDDAFIALSIIKQSFQFLFEENAHAFIKLPSRSPRHELSRRIRIVSTSLNGLRINKTLLNPLNFGLFSLGLFINKVLRRLLPLFLLVFFFSSVQCALSKNIMAQICMFIQLCAYFISFSYIFLRPISDDIFFIIKPLKKISSIGFFFCLGMLGTGLGVLSFLCGKKITKWDPIKEG